MEGRLKIVYILILFLVAVTVIVLMYGISDDLKGFLPNYQYQRNADVSITVPKPSRKKHILIYTTLFGVKHWGSLRQKDTKDYLNRTQCEYKNCIVTYDKKHLKLSDAVVFHDRGFMPKTGVLKDLSRRINRPRYQRWVYFNTEPPTKSYAGINNPYDNLFNWTMTYRLDSDIPLPYTMARELDERAPRPDPNLNYASSKTGKVVWLVSNCGEQFRMQFVHLLSKYIDVHVGGACGGRFKKHPKCTGRCDLNVVKGYKFYLSFENSFCRDYVTEKYYRAVESGLVPVVLGRGNYSDPRSVIPGSYIDATSFKSVKALGDYLNYLDKNDTAYNEYFKWKQKYELWYHGIFPFERYFLCKICERLNKDLPEKVYNKLSDFWSTRDCGGEEALRKKFFTSG